MRGCGMIKKIVLALSIFACVICTSCVSRLGAFTVISTKNIDWSRAAEYKRSNQKVEGTDIAHIIVIIPTKFNVTIEDAVDNALNQVPGAVALVDAVLRYKSFYIPYIYGQTAYIVEGSVLVDPKLADIDNASETLYYQAYYDRDKEFKVSKLDKSDYDEMQEKYQLN